MAASPVGVKEGLIALTNSLPKNFKMNEILRRGYRVGIGSPEGKFKEGLLN